MQTSEPTAHGYIMAQPPQIQGTPVGDYFNGLMRGLTHKQNNFLAVIQGFSSLILMSDGLEQSVRENLDHMKEAAQGAAGLGERILAASGCVRLNPQPMNLREYIPLIDGTLRASCSRMNVACQINVDADTPPILADNGRLKDILCEILTNAAEAAVAGGGQPAVALDILAPGKVAESRPGCVDIFVRNSGPAISPEKLKDVFRPFHSTRDSKHYGIGLTIAAVLLSQMGGTLGLRSDSTATTVWLSIPVA
jgi:C4-dicarboxylate-specific signal transduction histidine kinase